MPRPRLFDTEESLDRAMQVFWSRGFEATSVQALCGAMGLKPASLYGAFGDKRALYAAALDRYMARSQANFAAWVGDARGEDGLRALFAGLVRRLTADDGGRGCLVTNTAAELAPHDPELAERVRLHLGRLEVLLRRLLAEAGADADSAPALVCLAQGLNVMAKTCPERLPGIVDAALAPLLRPRMSS